MSDKGTERGAGDGLKTPYQDWYSAYDAGGVKFSSPYTTTPLFSPSAPASYFSALTEFNLEQQKILYGTSTLAPEKAERKFDNKAWRQNPSYRQLMQYYLAYCRFMQRCLTGSGLEGAELIRAQFIVESMLAALSPENSAYTNPAVQERIRETGGMNLVNGLNQYMQDLADNNPLPSQVNSSKFKPGENIATTPGSVVFRNELFELLQYQPTRKRVFERPVLLSSSPINKYYLSDLTPERSLYRHLLDQGFQVFVIVWRNPTREHAHWSLDDYVPGVVEAINITRAICDQETVNLSGFCAGGTFTLAALAYLASREQALVNSHSFMLNVVQSEPDDSLFTAIATPESIETSKRKALDNGICSADELTMLFAIMQPDKLIWPAFVQNYLMGEEPEGSEVMYWMNDQVNLPAQLYCQFLEIGNDNTLSEGKVTVRDIPIDLIKVDTETFILGALRDHIMPWSAVYRTRALLGGESTFLLSNGGHVTPMVTAADNPRESYFASASDTVDSEEWLARATEHQESWRTAWVKWLAKRSGEKVAAPGRLGDSTYKPLGPAPGSYVLE